MKLRPSNSAPFGDPFLAPYAEAIAERAKRVRTKEKALRPEGGTLADFACAHEYYGLHLRGCRWIFREWAPNATSVELVGDFNGWKADGSFALARVQGDPAGAWEGEWPEAAIRHGQRYHLVVRWLEDGSEREGERIPAYARRVVQDAQTNLFCAQVWEPKEQYVWKNGRAGARPSPCAGSSLCGEPPRIYEAHVGMAQAEGKVGTYAEFRDNILPRI